MDSSRAALYAALLLAVLACSVSAAPQQFGSGGFNRFPGPPGRPGPDPVYYDEDDSSDDEELGFWGRLIRPWRWFDPVYNYFNSGSDDDDEVYDEGGFPGQQVSRLDQRLDQRLRPALEQQRYVARPPPPRHTARSDTAPYRPEQVAAEAMHAAPESGSQA